KCGVGTPGGLAQLLDVAEALGLGAQGVVLPGLGVEALQQLQPGAQPGGLTGTLVGAGLPLLQPGAGVGEPAPRLAVLGEQGAGSRSWSDCPWTVTRSAARSARKAWGTLRPPAKDRERPCAGRVRARMRASSSSEPPASSTRAATSSETTKVPSTTARSAPVRTMPVSPRPPRSRSSPVSTMVVSAPVSAGLTGNPASSTREAEKMTPRFTMRISSITGPSFFLSTR